MSSSSYWVLPFFYFLVCQHEELHVQYILTINLNAPPRLDLICLFGEVKNNKALQSEYICYPGENASLIRCTYNAGRPRATLCARSSQFSLTSWVSCWHLCGIYTPCVGWGWHFEKLPRNTSSFFCPVAHPQFLRGPVWAC